MGNVKAANTYPGNEIVWEEDYNGDIVVSAAGPSIENATVPSTINGKPVKKVRGFENCKYLKTVTLPNTLTEIQSSTFEGCSALTTINIPDSIKVIDYWVFDGCSSLKSINLKNVTKIYPYAFRGCESLSSVTLSNNLTIIDESAFDGCSSLKSITLPSSLKTIGQQAFRNSGLTTITVPASVTKIYSNYGTFEGCKSLKTATINAQLEEIPSNMFKDCTNLTTVKFTGTKKVSMDSSIFENCTSLTSVTLPSNLTNIARESFKGCTALTNITIPDTVESVGYYAFEGCSRLPSIKLPCGVRTIDSYAFKNCNALKNIYFTKSIQTIANDVFYDTSTAGLTIYGYAGSAAKPFATERGIKFFECKPVTSIKISGDTSVVKKSSITLNANITPTDAYNKELKWTSSNTNVATVSSTGVVTGKGVGTATITAQSKDGTFISGTYKVTVKATDLPFTDVSVDNWYHSALKYCYSKKLITGLTSTKFGATTNLSRGMLATILWRMAGAPKTITGAKNFTDVTNKNDYFYTAVRWASSKKIINGYSDGKRFGPNDPITREQLAAMLRNYCQYQQKKYKAPTTQLTKYSDYKKVSPLLQLSMRWAVQNNVITGSNNKLNPQGKATRAEVASMLYKYCMNIK